VWRVHGAGGVHGLIAQGRMPSAGDMPFKQEPGQSAQSEHVRGTCCSHAAAHLYTPLYRMLRMEKGLLLSPCGGCTCRKGGRVGAGQCVCRGQGVGRRCTELLVVNSLP
jgi:hypothetical protein